MDKIKELNDITRKYNSLLKKDKKTQSMADKANSENKRLMDLLKEMVGYKNELSTAKKSINRLTAKRSKWLREEKRKSNS